MVIVIFVVFIVVLVFCCTCRCYVELLLLFNKKHVAVMFAMVVAGVLLSLLQSVCIRLLTMLAGKWNRCREEQ